MEQAVKIYIAGQYAKRDVFKECAKRLESIGIEITSRWLMEDKPLNTKMGDDTADFYEETAEIDLEDIDNADAILFFSEDPHIGVPRGGRHVEYGYALGKKKLVYTVNYRENIFHYLKKVNYFPSFEEFIAYVPYLIFAGGGGFMEPVSKETGRKDDIGKLRYDLVPVYCLKELVLTYTIGAAKYSDHNWRQGIKFSRVIAALKRHLELWLEGEERDPEGQHHLAAVAWNAFSLLWYSKFRPEFDDRVDIDEKYKK